jgi:hypothetical protein
MQASVSDKYVQQITDIARELPEEKLRSALAFARRMKTEPQRPVTPLTPQEMIALASDRAQQLKHQARPVAEAQYQSLLQAIQAEVESRNIVVEDFPRGD